MPTFQDLYTTIDKKIFRDYILYYGITEIQTDIGLFYENIKIDRYLQFRKEVSTFYFRDESDYYGGKAMISIAFRLDDLINIQKRKYTKLPEIFSFIGGYMQLISTVFTLLSFLPNKLIPQIKILNGIFNFNLKQNKMALKITSLKEFNSNFFAKNANNIIYYDSPVNRNLNNDKKNTNNISKNSLIGVDYRDNSSVVNIINNKKRSSVIQNKNDNSNISFLMYKNKRNSSHIISTSYKKKCISNKKQKYIYRIGSFYPKLSSEEKQENQNDFENGKSKDNSLKKNDDRIEINLFKYYCCNFSKKREDIQF